MSQYNYEKIRLMAKLAVYDKNEGKKDKKIMEHFKGDYVYKNNFLIRISVTIGFFLICSMYGMHLLFISDAVLEELNYFAMIRKVIICWLVLMVGYTALGTYIYSEMYRRAEVRQKKYFQLLDKLDALDKN